MKRILPLLVLVAVFASPGLQAQVLFSDSFETYANDYNQPNSSDSPYNNLVSSANGNATDQVRAGSIAGKDGSQYLIINTSAQSDSNTAPVTDTLSTKNNSTTIGTFQIGTSYTASVLMAQSQFGGDGQPGNLFTGTLFLIDGNTGAVLDSVSHNFATGTTGFGSYSFTFDSLGSPQLKGDNIQLALTANVNTNSFQEIDFDDVKLTATADTNIPEPTTYALLGLGVLAMVFGLRRKSTQTLRS